MKIKNTSKKKHNKKYETPKNIGEKGQMDVKFVPNECKAPKRSEEEIDYTFNQIEKRIAKNKRRTMWQNSGVLVAIAAILLFFIASNTFPFTNQTATGTSDIQSIYYTDHIITDNLGAIEKWYYIDKVKLRGEQFDLATQLIDRVDKGESFLALQVQIHIRMP